MILSNSVNKSFKDVIIIGRCVSSDFTILSSSSTIVFNFSFSFSSKIFPAFNNSKKEFINSDFVESKSQSCTSLSLTILSAEEAADMIADILCSSTNVSFSSFGVISNLTSPKSV